GVLGTRGDFDREVLLDQSLLDGIRQPGFILDQQNPQCVHTPDAGTPPHPKKVTPGSLDDPSDCQRQDAGGYQRACPDCVEVNPGAAQDCQTDPFVDQDCDGSSHRDHRARVYQHYRDCLRDCMCV